MKKNLIYIAYLFIAFVSASCADLDEEPLGLMAPESFFKTESDAEAAVMGAYAHLGREKLYGRSFQMLVEFPSDMIDIGDIGTATMRVEANEFRIDANNGLVTRTWPTFYEAIGAANTAIDGIPQIEMDETKKNALIAEARMVRALCYYHLVRLWGDIPYIDKFVTDPASLIDISKTSSEVVYQNIIEDCKFGMQHLPNSYDVENGVDGLWRSRVTKAAAASMLSSIYLTIKDYAKAAEMAEWVIDREAEFNLDLMPDFQSLFIADIADTKEHIWTIDFLGQITSGNPFAGTNVDSYGPITGIRNADQKGWSVAVPSPGVYDSFDDRDYRKKVSFQTEALVNGEMTPYTEWKWPRVHLAKWAMFPGSGAQTSGANSDHNYPVFRYAEVLLIAAEAINEAQGAPNAKAVEYINRIRERARNYNGTQADYPENISAGLSQEEFRQVVREERRVELAFEWKRWYDMKRWDDGDVTKYFNQPTSFENQPLVKSFNKLFPIPQDEIDRNENLLPQNDGY